MFERGNQSGSAATAALAITGAVALSAAAFFLFTLPATRKGEEPTDAGNGGDGASADVTTPPEGGGIAPTPPVEPNPSQPEPPVVVDIRSSPALLVGEITNQLKVQDFTAAAALLGGEIGGGVAGLSAAFGPEGYALAADQEPAEIGTTGEITRWVLPVRKRGIEVGESKPERTYIDLSAESAGRWDVVDLHYPEPLQNLVAAAVPEALSAGAQREKDALIMADGFITAVTGMDFVTALNGCDGDSVPEEKIAGLCIVFEEGEFKLRKIKPLVATALREDTAWVIAHVDSEKLGAGSEFGLEMKRKPSGDGGDGEWKVVGINFGKLLDTYVAGSEAGKVPFTPIKSMPGKGEMLVLYFEYDDNRLLPRARRQIEIISNILKADPGKTLSIAGHADALGSDDYNTSLSAARATSVKQQLVAFGVPEPQVRTEGFGEAKPWKPNLHDDGTDDPKGRRYNRRAEIYLNF
jgi:hypothetical protein